MKIIATKVKTEDLKPGDLFSTATPQYWDSIHLSGSLGEKVYIRTETPCPIDQTGEDIYKIKIKKT